jgi:radical SAM protein with 4Fe4S-binding SPASM domain
MPELLNGIQTNPHDVYGWARFPETKDRIPYGRFRNLYLYITEQCQLRCGHCYMGDRLESSVQMPYEKVCQSLSFWRKMGSSKLTILGGEATLHKDFERILEYAYRVGYEKTILTTNGLLAARKKLLKIHPCVFAYVQVSLDGASPKTHDTIRGKGKFEESLETIKLLCEKGFDTRIICTVNKVNIHECLDLLPIADSLGVTLVKFHVFSGIGNGKENSEWVVDPYDWISFYKVLEQEKGKWNTQIWYQPTYALKTELEMFTKQGYQGCIGRTMDRISVFPDGKAYICSYLFDTDLNFLEYYDGKININRGQNEFELFTQVLTSPGCNTCVQGSSCQGGCPAEEIVMEKSPCSIYSDIYPVCRLWKADI